MPPSKRKPRRKAADMNNDTSEVDILNSSPRRQPSGKKRKINGVRASTRRKSVSPEPMPPNRIDDSGDESETVSQSDLIDSVVSYLQVAKDPVVATTEYANEKEQQENVQKVSAYAKIAGRDWTYFVRQQSVNIGRPPDTAKEANGMHAAASSPVMEDMKETVPVHIDLGPSKVVSRHHASIFYDGEFPEGGGWHVRVNGRNGMRVNNGLLKRGNRMQIKSGTILEIAGTQMMFVTPGDKAQIDQSFIDRAKALATGEEFPNIFHSHPDQDLEQNGGYQSIGILPQGSFQSLAPAPPNFQRARTPPQHSADGRDQRGVFDSKPAQSGMYNRGLMMESTQEIDYSRDAAKDLKPPYSYATMIAQAIFSSEEEKLTLSNIYAYIVDKFAFYRHSNSGWQNSIRHNLSLNKAFQKVPRRTDEPGKGMKWQIAPEYRQEYWRKQARKGASSAPSSPASGKEVNPNFRGPNGQNLGYDTTMVSQFSAKDMSDRPVPPPPANIHFNQGHPPMYNPLQQAGPTSTPQRRRTDTLDTLDSPISPYHMHHGPGQPTPGPLPAYAIPSSVPRPHHSPTNPTLSSSYLDTPFPHSQTHQWPMNTPAPLRQNPRLAPPSTLVAPSKFMPDSSPGGPSSFWKQIGVLGTPGTANRGVDISPLKTDMDAGRNVMSSSPPPMESHSPSKMASSSQRMNGSSFSGNGRVAEAAHNGANATIKMEQSRSASNGTHGISVLPSGPISAPVTKKQDSDDEGSVRFDLARGFAPIGAPRSAAAQLQ